MTEQIKKDYVIQHREEETGSPDRKKWEIGNFEGFLYLLGITSLDCQSPHDPLLHRMASSGQHVKNHCV